MEVKRPITKQNGFTLIELVLYAGMISFILVAVSLFVSFIISSRARSQVRAEVDQQGQQVMAQMSQQIRTADLINVPAAGVTTSNLSLKPFDSSKNPILFSLSGTTLQTKEGAAAAVDVTNSRISVTALSFQNLTAGASAGSIRIIMTMSYVNNSGRPELTYSQTFQTTATVRGK